jgi:hypothetical protein
VVHQLLEQEGKRLVVGLVEGVHQGGELPVGGVHLVHPQGVAGFVPAQHPAISAPARRSARQLSAAARKSATSGVHPFQAKLVQEALFLVVGVGDEGPAGGAGGPEQDVRQHHAFRVPGEAHAQQQVAQALALAFEEAGDGEAAHELGDVVHEVGVGGDVVGLGEGGAQGLEEYRQGHVHLLLADGPVAGAVVVEDLEAVVGPGDAGQADDEGVGRLGVVLLQEAVPVGIDDVGKPLSRQPGVQGRGAPGRVPVGGVEEAGQGGAAPRFSSTFMAARGNSYMSLGAMGLPSFMARMRLSLSAGMALPLAGSMTPARAPAPR